MSLLRVVVAVAAVTSLIVSVAVALLFGAREPELPAVAAAPAPRPALEWERTPTSDDSEIAALQSALESERSARIALAQQIEELREAIAQRQSTAARPASGPAPSELGDPNEVVDAESELAERWFDEQALRSQGMSESEIRRLRQRFDDIELEKLYARDRAAREGWSDSSRHYREMREIQDEFREELGDSEYDAVLYASGRKNRVRVQDVLHGSPAANSGLLPGDVIVSYAGRRVFDTSSLYVQTTEGEIGETVEVEVRRGNEIVLLEVPRGPLGVKMDHFKAPPGG
jgi:hypothetical protein